MQDCGPGALSPGLVYSYDKTLESDISMTSTWTVVHLPGGETAFELLSEPLADLGAEGYTSDEEALHVFFRNVTAPDQLLDEINALYQALAAEEILPQGTLSLEEVAEEDWVGRWRRSLGPILAGERFVVIPPGVEAEPEPGRIALRLEPRMAFGTGEHATTRMALALLEKTVQPGDRVLDLGCGNGVLAIGALLLGAGSAFGIDNEQEAVDETLENAGLHGVGDKMTARFGDVLADPIEGSYDLLLANIFVNPILAGLPDWLKQTTPDARCIFTGVQAGDEENRLLEGVRKLGLQVEETLHLEGWIAARCKRLPA